MFSYICKKHIFLSISLCIWGFSLWSCLPIKMMAAGGTVSVVDFGAKNDATNANQTTAAFRAAFNAALDGTITVPAGNYLIDNSNGPFQVNNFSGSLVFDPNAKVIFTDNTQGGFDFAFSNNAHFINFNYSYQTLPTSRILNRDAIKMEYDTNTVVTAFTGNGSPEVGFIFFNSNNPHVTNVTITNTMADGLHFANSQDVQATNVTTRDTGDDGLAFLNYAMYGDKNGGYASNISVTRSKARGITIVGQSNVTINGFTVTQTADPGVYVAYESAYNTRIPTNDIIENGTITGAGTYPGQSGNGFGVEYEGVASTTFSGIQISGSANRGFSGATNQTGTVHINNISVSNNLADSGFNIGGNVLNVNNLFATQSPLYGIFIANSNTVFATGLTTTNVSTLANLHRAVWFENNQNITVSGVQITDTQSSPTGYVLGEYNNVTGTINNIAFTIPNGSLATTSNSTGIRISTPVSTIALVQAPAPIPIQNSVAPSDSTSSTPLTFNAATDFSTTTQGYNGWSYLDSNGTPMVYDTVDNWWKGIETYNFIVNNGQHPGNNADSVRRWTAPQSGTIHITGSAYDRAPGGTDGVVASIKQDGQMLWQETITEGDSAGYSFDLNRSVISGDTIDFIVNKGIDNTFDNTYFNPTIVLTPLANSISTSTNGNTDKGTGSGTSIPIQSNSSVASGIPPVSVPVTTPPQNPAQPIVLNSSGGGSGGMYTSVISPSVNTSTSGIVNIKNSQNSQSFTSVMPQINLNLNAGMKGTLVLVLQKFLVLHSYLRAGLATGYYGSLTEAAVKAFQRNNGIVSFGTAKSTGYGALGPKTRALINMELKVGK